MEFSEFANRETSDLVARLVATASGTSRQRVAAFRAALATATDSLEAALITEPELDGAVLDVVERLRAAAAAQADAAAQQVALEASATADGLKRDIEHLTRENDTLQAALGEAGTQAERLRTDIRAEKEQVEVARRELAEARAVHKRLEAARLEAVATSDKEASARAVADGEVRQLRAAHDDSRAESARQAELLEAAASEKRQLEDAIDAARTQADAAEAKLAAVTALLNESAARVRALEREAKEQARKRQNVDVQAQSTSPRSGSNSDSLLDGVLGGFEALASATTIPDVLTTLVEQLAAEFPRVARFRVKGNRLQGEHHIGFDLKSDIAKVVVPLSMDSLLTRAVSSSHIERLTGEALADASGAPLGGTPTYALALPVVVNGDALGVIYADDSGQAGQRGDLAAYDARAKFAEALLQHAIALLTRLTKELGTMAELRAYALSLVNEIEQMYAADVNAGRTGADLQGRLKANVDYARSIYANRVAFECPDAASLMDDEFEGAVETHRETPFARDLGALIQPPAATRRTAEAS